MMAINGRVDRDKDMMVYDEHLDKWKENDKTPSLSRLYP